MYAVRRILTLAAGDSPHALITRLAFSLRENTDTLQNHSAASAGLSGDIPAVTGIQAGAMKTRTGLVIFTVEPH